MDPDKLPPTPEFIDDVSEYMNGKNTDSVIKSLNENYRLFKLEESRLLQRRLYILNKLPDIQKSLNIVNFLMQKDEHEEVNNKFCLIF